MKKTEEFNINNYIVQTLKPTGVPVFFASKKENSVPLIMFNVTNISGHEYWEDGEMVTQYRIMINIFSRSNFMNLMNQVVKLMIDAGFIRLSITSCEYNEDIDLYNQPLTFAYYKEQF